MKLESLHNGMKIFLRISLNGFYVGTYTIEASSSKGRISKDNENEAHRTRIYCGMRRVSTRSNTAAEDRGRVLNALFIAWGGGVENFLSFVLPASNVSYPRATTLRNAKRIIRNAVRALRP